MKKSSKCFADNLIPFGIFQALQNLGTAVITLAAGNIVDQLGYFWLETFFVGWLTVALLSGLVIWAVDYSNGGTPEMLNIDNNKTFVQGFLNRTRGQYGNSEMSSYEAVSDRL